MNSTKKQKTANLLTICLKAGKVVKGFDSACDAVKSGLAMCLLTASDASDKTSKEAEFISGKYGIPCIKTELEKAEIAVFCGKETAVLAICDKGFAEGFMKIHKP